MQQSIIIIIVLTIYLWHLMILYVFLWFQYVSIISITQRSHKSVPWLWHEAGFALISCQISRIACACNSCRKTLGFPMNFIAATAPLKEGHASNVKSVHAEKNPRNLGLCSLRCFFPIALITPSDSYQLPLNPFEFGISRYPHNYQSPFPIRSVFFSGWFRATRRDFGPRFGTRWDLTIDGFTIHLAQSQTLSRGSTKPAPQSAAGLRGAWNRCAFAVFLLHHGGVDTVAGRLGYWFGCFWGPISCKNPLRKCGKLW